MKKSILPVLGLSLCMTLISCGSKDESVDDKKEDDIAQKEDDKEKGKTEEGGEEEPAEGDDHPGESEDNPGEGDDHSGEGEDNPGEGDDHPGEGENDPGEGNEETEEHDISYYQIDGDDYVNALDLSDKNFTAHATIDGEMNAIVYYLCGESLTIWEDLESGVYNLRAVVENDLSPFMEPSCAVFYGVDLEDTVWEKQYVREFPWDDDYLDSRAGAIAILLDRDVEFDDFEFDEQSKKYIYEFTDLDDGYTAKFTLGFEDSKLTYVKYEEDEDMLIVEEHISDYGVTEVENWYGLDEYRETLALTAQEAEEFTKFDLSQGTLSNCKIDLEIWTADAEEETQGTETFVGEYTITLDGHGHVSYWSEDHDKMVFDVNSFSTYAYNRAEDKYELSTDSFMTEGNFGYEAYCMVFEFITASFRFNEYFVKCQDLYFGYEWTNSTSRKCTLTGELYEGFGFELDYLNLKVSDNPGYTRYYAEVFEVGMMPEVILGDK